jgi:hypothetical protein
MRDSAGEVLTWFRLIAIAALLLFVIVEGALIARLAISMVKP